MTATQWALNANLSDGRSTHSKSIVHTRPSLGYSTGVQDMETVRVGLIGSGFAISSIHYEAFRNKVRQ